uniref:Uncharacterized protein n=1 Tax=Arion vulgaris TaxID=1028688 RepID=A0A0B7ABM6_9EUPU
MLVNKYIYKLFTNKALCFLDVHTMEDSKIDRQQFEFVCKQFGTRKYKQNMKGRAHKQSTQI